MAEDSLNIYQKLAKIRKQVEVVKKNKSGYGYKYVTDDELLARITGLMDKYSLSLIPSIVPCSTHYETYHYLKSKYNKDTRAYYEEHNNEIIVKSDMRFCWINNDNPDEKLIVPWSMIGQQTDASQSFGSGLTYSFRYFLLKFFNVATPDDDPDEWRRKQQEAEKAEEKALVEATVAQIDSVVKSYLASHNSEKDTTAIKEFISKYASKGNYLGIKNLSTAIQLLNDLRAWVGTKEE